MPESKTRVFTLDEMAAYQGLGTSQKQAVREFLEAAAAEERKALRDWLAHRCGYSPPCGRCTYCGVAKHIAVLDAREMKNA